MNRFIVILVFVYHLLYYSSGFSSSTNANETPDSCVTPHKKLGECILVTKCKFCVTLMSQTPLSLETINYLKESQCGFEGTEPKVCCPVDELKGLIWDESSNRTTSNLLPNTYNCGLHEYNIVLGNTPAAINEFPWTALLEYDKPSGRGFHCGGALINNKYVLTAAHCIERMPEHWKLIRVRLGEYNLKTHRDCFKYDYSPKTEHCSTHPLDIAISKQIVHEKYDAASHSQLYDIALLRLVEEVTFTDFVTPICLSAASHDLNNPEIKLIVSGWGLSDNEKQVHSDVKLKALVPLKSNSECALAYSNIQVHLNGHQVCTESENPCTIDSGGPLVFHKQTSTGYNWYLAGVMSYGPTPCGNHNWPDVYTRVTDYVEWIIGNLKP